MRFGITASLLALLVLPAIGVATIGPAAATVAIRIDLSTQLMHVRAGSASYTWPVSTARRGYTTPRGSYRSTLLKRMHYSRKYDMSPMPHSIFFHGGYAIHGTYETRHLGRPASHGCVRLAPRNAARLYEMVAAEGASITVVGTSPHMVSRGTPPRLSPQAATARRRSDPLSAYTSEDEDD